MKRPRIADHASEQRLRRERAAGAAAALMVGAAIVLLCTQGGMLYDRAPVGGTGGGLPALAVPLGALVVGLAAVLWAATDSRLALLRWAPTSVMTVCVALLLCWSGIRWFGTPDRLNGLTQLGLLVTAAGIGLVLGGQHSHPRVLALAVVALVLSGLILAALGIREYLAEWVRGDPGWRVFAGFSVPNFLAGLFVTVLPLSVALLLGIRDRLGTVVLALALVLETAAMLLTQSRLGVAALAVAGLTFAMLLLWGRLLRGEVARRALVILLGILVVGGLASGPVVRRLRASRDQSYSARFRVMTWQGALRMVRERPLTGMGTGSFDATYPRYAVVGYTQHAHNSFLQWACETGVPGLWLLVSAAAASLWGALSVLRAAHHEGWPLGDERVLAAGLAAGLVGSAVHNVFDSDLYVPANMAALAAVMGLLGALGRRVAPAARPSARPARGLEVPRWVWAPVLAVPAVLLIVGASRLLTARVEVVTAARALADQDVIGALDAFRIAARANPLDPEPHLAMASIHDRLNEAEAALRALRAAVRAAPSGKTYYRLGKYLVSTGAPRQAVAYLEKARHYDPRHLRTLLALAEAYRASGQGDRADQVYEDMIRLYRSPVGQVRAIPEVVDWEYGLAFAGLAEHALTHGRFDQAEKNLQAADSILSELWRTRHEPMVQVRITADALREASARYEWVLAQRAVCLEKLRRPEQAREVQTRLATLRQEMDREAGSSR